jgi:hypothetical protein
VQKGPRKKRNAIYTAVHTVHIATKQIGASASDEGQVPEYSYSTFSLNTLEKKSIKRKEEQHRNSAKVAITL